MLYHVPDRTMELSEIHKALRPGGRLFATTMGCGHLRELKDIVERIVPGAYSNGTSVEECGLENGTKQITKWFPEIALRRW
jgi:2-polyprenyl-3-methyl-5-hydroxy-6-metoxy-1,4-benzoquinol methylase